MIPEKYKIGDKWDSYKIIDGKRRQHVEGVDVLSWLEDIEERSTRNKANLQSVGNILNPVNGVSFQGENKKVDISFSENGKKISELMKDIKDPKKQMSKIHEFTEFIIFNLLAAAGPDGKKMEHHQRKQIVDNALRKVEKEEKEKEKVPAPPKEKEEKKKWSILKKKESGCLVIEIKYLMRNYFNGSLW